VAWAIDVSADSPREAAQQARDAQTREGTTATVFEVAQQIGERFGEPVTVDLDEEQPDERLVPDFQMDVAGEYGGNAYPESHGLRIGITVLGTGEDFGLTVETEGGDVVGSMTISLDEADGIIRMGTTDHSLSGYEDDWKIPGGMERTIEWVLPTDMNYTVILNANQIDEVAEWFSYATGEKTWDWAEQGEEWGA
jgi:hypothetical protein